MGKDVQILSPKPFCRSWPAADLPYRRLKPKAVFRVKAMNKYVILINPETTGLHLIEKIQDSGYLPVAAYTFDRKKWRKYQAEGELICPDEFCVKEMFHAVYFSSKISALIRDLKSLCLKNSRRPRDLSGSHLQ